MARINAFVHVISSIRRRGYSAASAAVMRRGGAMEEKMAKDGAHHHAEKASWVPDPVTGYYRPADRMGEMDPAELRRMLLTRKA